jgi:hypothetical protein
VNDDELLAAMRSTLTCVRDSMTDVHLDRPAAAITARARTRRLRRRLTGAGAVGVAALAVALVGLPLARPAGHQSAGSASPAPDRSAPPARSASPGSSASSGGRSVHVNLDAWSVNTTPGGLVVVTIRELQDPALFRQTLAEAGVPAVVSVGEFCRPATNQSQITQQLIHVLKQSTSGGNVMLTINPAAMPAGSELDIGIVSTSRGLIAAFGLAEKGAPLTRCGPMMSTLSPTAAGGLG